MPCFLAYTSEMSYLSLSLSQFIAHFGNVRLPNVRHSFELQGPARQTPRIVSSRTWLLVLGLECCEIKCGFWLHVYAKQAPRRYTTSVNPTPDRDIMRYG